MIRKFKKLGFTGPHPGKNHPVMKRGSLKVPITNEHDGEKSDPGRDLMKNILKIAGIPEKDWLNA